MKEYLRILVLFFTTFAPTIALAEDESCKKFNDLVKTLGAGDIFTNLPKICDAQSFILWVISQALIYVGIIATLFVIYGGFMYVTSGGNDETAENAKKILTNSALGLVVVILASTLVRVLTSVLDV